MYGRRFLSCTVASSCTELHIFCHVHGGYEYPQCDCSGIDFKFYGNGTAGGSDLLGKYVIFGRPGPVRACLVDDFVSGLFSGDNLSVSDESGQSFAGACQPKTQQSVEKLEKIQSFCFFFDEYIPSTTKILNLPWKKRFVYDIMIK